MQSTRRRFELFLVLCLALAQASGAKASSETAEPTSIGNDSQKLASLVSLVNASGMSIWIEYHGSCGVDKFDGMTLRLRINPNRQETGSDALASVRSMLEENEKLSIGASTPGIITVTTPNVWSPLLDVKLGKLKLIDADRYNPSYAIMAALGASHKSLDDLHAKSLFSWFSLLGELPSAGRPHLKKSSRYATLNDLLVDVSRTFPGVLAYKECTLPDSSHVYDLQYYRASEFLP